MPVPQVETNPRLWIACLKFSDDSTITFAPNDIVVVVGPNNSGKSAVLRAVRDKATTIGAPSPVITQATFSTSGTTQDVLSWLEKTTQRSGSPNENPSYTAFGTTTHKSHVEAYWPNAASGLQNLARFFVTLLNSEGRLQAADAAPVIAMVREAPSHPIHFLYRDEAVEKKLSTVYRKAFGADLVVDRGAGGQIPLYTGTRPELKEGQDRISPEYVAAIENLTLLSSQGDGMRSFAGILLNASVGRESVLLLDEPEAFLHPPQARFLGKMLVAETPASRQIFVATHSGDVLRGILDANPVNIRIVRLQRDGAVNRTRELNTEKIAALWNDPLLRFSNILDGIFHERVIIGEGDADCRFYAAVGDAITAGKEGDQPVPDTMFVHGGGKHRMPLLVRALRELGVPVRVVVDFDVFNAEQPLRALVESAGGLWAALEGDWTILKKAVDAKKPEFSTDDVSQSIREIIAKIEDKVFPDVAVRRIKDVLQKSSPWSIAKSAGRSYVPNGDPTNAYNRLTEALTNLGILVVPVGELESFARSIPHHGPKWVNAVLQKNLKEDGELEEARQFVRSLIL